MRGCFESGVTSRTLGHETNAMAVPCR